jgi:tetratricopeptide (TPR) repeat protein
VQVRIGLNTGEAIQEEADLFGEAVDAAARIMAKAEGGQILVSETVRAVIGSAKDLQFVDRGRFRLKGFPERWRLYEAAWRKEAPTAGPAVAERTPFVGRESERAKLRRCLDQVTRGRGALVMIGGEPGVGKTRLAEEVLLEARQRGLLSLTGHCYETEGAPPYIPFVETLEATARIVPREALREALGDAAPEVAKLMPELRRLFPDIPPPLELPPEQERRYLFNSFQEFLGRASHVQPLLLVLEDLHWGDDATLLLLQHIAQQLSQMPVLILGTYRDVELDDARPLARVLEELHRQRLATRLALKRLPEAEVESMLRALSGQAPPSSLVQVIYSETEGNPFFVEEVYRHLAEEGTLFDDSGHWRSDLELGELDVPEGVRLVITRRIRRVSEGTRRVLTGAAIIGRVFAFQLLEALGEVEADALLDVIDEAERAHLITSTADGPEARFTFAHELIRQTLVSGLSLPRRQRLHLRVAEAMERLYARALEEHAGDLAYHLYRAGTAAEPEKTAHYLVLAGERALEAVAFEDALRHYENALSLQPADDRKGQAGLLFKRGLALRSLGRWEEALSDWRGSLAIYEELGDIDAAGCICDEMCRQLDWAMRWAESLQTAGHGLALLGEQVSPQRCRLAAQAGLVFSLAGTYSQGAQMLDEALALAEQLGSPSLTGWVIHHKTFHHLAYAQLGDLANAGRRAIDLLRASGEAWLLADVLWLTQWGLLYAGRPGEAARIAAEAEPLAVRVGHLGALIAVRRAAAGHALMSTGGIEAYERFARADLELCRDANSPLVAHSHTFLGNSSFWRGGWREALGSFEKAVTLEPAGLFAGFDWGQLFLGKAYFGDRDSALAMLEQSHGNLPSPGRASTVGAWALLFAEIEGLAVLGERERAAELYPVLKELVDSGVIIRWPTFTLNQTVAGMAAAAGGGWDKAEEHYQTALRQAHEIPVVIEQPEVRRWYAHMLIDRDAPGDGEKARELLTEAIAMYRRIGMPKHVEMAEALLGGI